MESALAAKTELKTIASEMIQQPAVTIERIKLRRRVITFPSKQTIGRGRRKGEPRRPLIARDGLVYGCGVGQRPHDWPLG